MAVSTLLEANDLPPFYIGAGIFQFPVVKGLKDNIQVSISHCDDIGIALAFPEEHPLGLDIEKISNQRIDVMKSHVSAKEIELLQACGLSSAPGLALAWTAKEALSKVLRTGLTADFAMLEISTMNSSGAAYTSTFRHCAQYQALSYYSGDYACSIVLPGKTTANLEPLFDCFKAVVST